MLSEGEIQRRLSPREIRLLPEVDKAAYLEKLATEQEEERKVRYQGYHAKYRAKNKDLLHQRTKEYRDKNPDKVRVFKRAWNERNKEKVAKTSRASRFKREYGITLEDFDNLLAKQGSVCAICKRTEPVGRYQKWHVDHCHSTGRVRGILCHHCNVGIGNLQDSPKTLRAAAGYLEKC